MLTRSRKDISTPPGRPYAFLKGDNRNLKPYSCVLRKYKGDLPAFLSLLAIDLCGGAGVKVNLDNFKSFAPISANWGFYLDPEHPDFTKMSPDQAKLYTTIKPKDRIIRPDDSMSGENGLRASWESFIMGLAPFSPLRNNRIVVDLSNLRPAGSVNSVGLEASGALGQGKPGETSFLSIYEAIANHLSGGDIATLLVLLGTLNETLRRGGFKRGIICTSLSYNHPQIENYLNFPNYTCPGGHKKAVRLDAGILNKGESFLELLAESCEKESTFLEKIKPKRPDLYANVCQGLAIPDGGICTLWRINLGMIEEIDQIPLAMVEGTIDAMNLHLNWRNKFTPEELAHVPTLKEDKQIGLDIMGMASMLAHFEVSYEDFTRELRRFNEDESFNPRYHSVVANRLLKALAAGYGWSSLVADNMCEEAGLLPLERIHTVEPSQRHFTDCDDVEGFTTTRCIFPPFERTQRRVSDHEEQKIYHHNPKIETAAEVGATLNYEFACEWKRFMDTVARPHGYMSFDSFEPITPNWIKKFIESPLESKYYSEASRFDQSFMKKDSAVCELGRADECLVCSE